jgi:hypothetical protein
MEKELLETIGNFRIYTEPDTWACNPLLDSDMYPPTLVYCDGRVDGYAEGNEASDAVTVYDFLPFIEEEKCLSLLSDMTHEQEESDYYVENANGIYSDALATFVVDNFANPATWQQAERYFNILATLATEAGVVHCCTSSYDYSGAGYTYVFSALIPEWVDTAIGSEANTWIAEHGEVAVKTATTDYEAWANGEACGYMVSKVLSDGTEEDTEESCWGYYDTAWMLEEARRAVGRLLIAQKEEEREAFDAACRDVMTVR